MKRAFVAKGLVTLYKMALMFAFALACGGGPHEKRSGPAAIEAGEIVAEDDAGGADVAGGAGEEFMLPPWMTDWWPFGSK